MSGTSVKSLLNETTTVVLSPGYEGANIGTIIGFKHVNYLVEKAVIEHFRRSGLPVGRLYEENGLGFDVTAIDSRLQTALVVDDEAVFEVSPVTKDADTELSFKVTVTVEREGAQKKAVTSKVKVALRHDENDVRMLRRLPAAEGLDQFVTPRIGGAEPGEAVASVGEPLVSGGSTDRDPVLDQLLAGQNAYGWKFRIPYPYVHFFDRLQMSGYLRLMEEAKHRFVDARGISIRTLLDEQNHIPAVTHSKVTLLDEALLEEDLYIVYTVDDIFKNLLYTSRLDYYVVRDGHLVKTATGTITHAYGVVENGSSGRLVTFDERVLNAFNNTGDTVSAAGR
jgi:acyl-CoA thioesterase FadM